jgi:transcriptional regulator with XRE-family HTH domain
MSSSLVGKDAKRRKALGAKIRQLRQAAGYESMEAFAFDLGVSWITISRYERGVSEISVGRLDQIAKVLDVPVTHLLGDGA